MVCFTNVPVVSYAIPKVEEEEDDDDDDGGGEILGGTDGDEYFCSLKVHRHMTQIQRRTVLLFDVARLPLRAK